MSACPRKTIGPASLVTPFALLPEVAAEDPAIGLPVTDTLGLYPGSCAQVQPRQRVRYWLFMPVRWWRHWTATALDGIMWAMGDQPMSIDPAEMERLAAEHDLNSSQAATWSVENIGFVQEYLRTHGLVNYPTVVKLIDFYLAKQAAGSAYAERHAAAATNLRAATARLVDQDAASAAGVAGTNR